MKTDGFDAATFEAARERLGGDVEATRVAAVRELFLFNVVVLMGCADRARSRSEVAADVQRMIDRGDIDAFTAADRANAALQWALDRGVPPSDPVTVDAVPEDEAPSIDAALLRRARWAARTFDDAFPDIDLCQRMARDLRALENAVADLSIMGAWLSTRTTTSIVLHYAAGFGVGPEEYLERFAGMLRWVVGREHTRHR